MASLCDEFIVHLQSLPLSVSANYRLEDFVQQSNFCNHERRVFQHMQTPEG
jgi:hypothetical protein